MAAAEAAPAEAALDSSGLSPKEEGELEDGEISDDDNNGSGPCGGGSEPGGGLAGNRPYSRRRPPPGLRGGISLSSSRRFPRSRHQPPPEMGHLHGHGGYRPKDSFRSHPPPLPAPRMPSGPHSETGPRLSFWERSHNALDRFRFRGRPYRGGWRWGRSRGGGERGGNPPGRPPGGGSCAGFSGNQGWREPSPRKCILLSAAGWWPTLPGGPAVSAPRYVAQGAGRDAAPLALPRVAGGSPFAARGCGQLGSRWDGSVACPARSGIEKSVAWNNALLCWILGAAVLARSEPWEVASVRQYMIEVS